MGNKKIYMPIPMLLFISPKNEVDIPKECAKLH